MAAISSQGWTNMQKKDASKPRRKKDSSLRTLRGITNNELLNGFGQKLWSICGSIRD